ncbi:MAG: DUF6363 domain-containing protein [Patescibacteria group bacterium]
MAQTILVLQPGGMRNVVVSGIISELGIKPKWFDAVYASSSTAAPTAFWLAGQQDITFHVWLKLIEPEIFSSKRWPPADIDRLVDVACEELDREKIFQENTKLIISVCHPKSGQTRYVTANLENIQNLLKATVSIPLFTRRVFIDGERLTDGGTKDILPTEDLKRYPDDTKFVYLLNRPLNSKMKSYNGPTAQIVLPRYPKAWAGLRQRDSLYYKSVRFISDGLRTGNTYVIAPETDTDIARFERSKEKIVAGYKLGLQLGEHHRKPLEQFLDK